MQKKDNDRDSKRKIAVYAIGRPDTDKMTNEEKKVFYRTLLQCAVEYFRQGKGE